MKKSILKKLIFTLLVPAILILIDKYLTHIFLRQEPGPESRVNKVQTTTLAANDSGKILFNQNKTDLTSSAKRDVINEIVYGDKTINNNNSIISPIKANKKLIDKNPDTVITIKDNHGFINNGGNGNTYNQTLNEASEQRQINEDDIKTILEYIPTKEQIVEIWTPLGDAESAKFGRLILTKLIELGYSARIGGVEVVTNYPKSRRITFEKNSENLHLIHVSPKGT